MNDWINSFFTFFEREKNPYPYSIFRILFYLGIIIHIAPSLYYFDENFTSIAFNKPGWSHIIWKKMSNCPIWVLQLCRMITISSLLGGILGLSPRINAFITAMSFYMFCSLNGLNLQSLAVGIALGILWLMFIIGDQSNTLTLRSYYNKSVNLKMNTNLLSGLILTYLCIGMFFAGIEKIKLDWPFSNIMHSFLIYPKGFMLRDWAVSCSFMQSEYVGLSFSLFTVLIEIFAPIGIYFQSTRKITIILWEIFFIGIVITFAVPPLFYFIFAGGALLALEEDSLVREEELESCA